MRSPSERLFTVDDLDTLSTLAIDTWRRGVDLGWSVRAGTLDWSCRDTAAHAIDTVFAPAFFLAFRRQHDYPGFTELRPLPSSTNADLVDGLRAVTTMLRAVILTTEPGATAIIRRHPSVEAAEPGEFAPRGALEMVLHTHDIAAGLGLDFEPRSPVCRRLADHTAGWPDPVTRLPRPLRHPRLTTPGSISCIAGDADASTGSRAMIEVARRTSCPGVRWVRSGVS